MSSHLARKMKPHDRSTLAQKLDDLSVHDCTNHQVEVRQGICRDMVGGKRRVDGEPAKQRHAVLSEQGGRTRRTAAHFQHGELFRPFRPTWRGKKNSLKTDVFIACDDGKLMASPQVGFKNTVQEYCGCAVRWKVACKKMDAFLDRATNTSRHSVLSPESGPQASRNASRWINMWMRKCC